MKSVYLGLVDYDTAVILQEQFFYGKLLELAEQPEDIILFLEHPPVYTYGIFVKNPGLFIKDPSLIGRDGAFLRASSRGGLMTFHGPGQLVCYPILDIGMMGVRDYISHLAKIVQKALDEFKVNSIFRENGLWVEKDGEQRKICSFGMRIGMSRKSSRITMHGFALNVNVDMKYFAAIAPCGIARPNTMANLSDLIGNPPDLKTLSEIITVHFAQQFGRTITLLTPEDIGFYPKRKPLWLKISGIPGQNIMPIRNIVRKNMLTTVCEEACCPNINECWSAGDVTFMILGDTCTRSCGFCAVKTGRPKVLDETEPERVSQAVKKIPHSHIVLTSVNRDDLSDGGSALWARTIRKVRTSSPQKSIEVLVPDFKGVREDIERVLDARPHVFGHNIETVRRLHRRVRPQGDYDVSLEVLRLAKEHWSSPITKSNIMLGHGESECEIIETMKDLVSAGVDILTITQYLRPTYTHLPVIKYYTPEEFRKLEQTAYLLGFKAVVASPLARTSWRAGEAYRKATQNPAT